MGESINYTDEELIFATQIATTNIPIIVGKTPENQIICIGALTDGQSFCGKTEIF
jgi:hypothetical protein